MTKAYYCLLVLLIFIIVIGGWINPCDGKVKRLLFFGHRLTVIQAKDKRATNTEAWRHGPPTTRLIDTVLHHPRLNKTASKLRRGFTRHTKWYMCSLAYGNTNRQPRDVTTEFAVRRVRLLRGDGLGRVTTIMAASAVGGHAWGDVYGRHDRAVPIMLDRSRVIGAVFFRAPTPGGLFHFTQRAVGCGYELTHITRGGSLALDAPEFTYETARIPWITHEDVDSLPPAPVQDCGTA